MVTNGHEATAFTFPDELKKAVEGLDNPTRWQIVEALISNGKSSHTSLMTALGLDNTGDLNPHLKTLLQSGLLDRSQIFGSQNRERSFYDVSAFGKNVVNGLMSALVPPVPKSLYEGLSIQIPVSANLWGLPRESADALALASDIAAAASRNVKRPIPVVQ